jgi:hypothetical protein
VVLAQYAKPAAWPCTNTIENYRSYGEIEGRIEKALSAIQDDLELTCAEAACQFFVPYPRLYARLKQHDSKTTRPCTNLRLTEE